MMIWTEENATMLEPAFAEIRRAQTLEAGARWSRRQGAEPVAVAMTWEAAVHRMRAGRLFRELTRAPLPTATPTPRTFTAPRPGPREAASAPAQGVDPPPDDEGPPRASSARTEGA